MCTYEHRFMERAVQLGIAGMGRNEGGPFGAVVVLGDQVVGEGNNQVILLNDPTAHAEVVAIRNACKNLNTYQLTDCVIYSSCEPCPMCLGSIYWARPKAVYYGCTQRDAAEIGFDDNFIYEELKLQHQDRRIPFLNHDREFAITAFHLWKEKIDKQQY